MIALADAVQHLYAGMENSLLFPAEVGKGTLLVRPAVAPKERDRRGVRCPMNFVRIKFDLSGMQTGERLRVLLDDGDPSENAPRWLVQEGHNVLSQIKDGNFWAAETEKR